MLVARNLDSTCYMNVGLQCLFQTPGLTPTISRRWNHPVESARDTGRVGDVEGEKEEDGGGDGKDQCKHKLRGGRKPFTVQKHLFRKDGTVVQSYLNLATRVWDSKKSIAACVSPEELK
eukprot:1371633-Amorphochlora_amoeboformis.AAC.2